MSSRPSEARGGSSRNRLQLQLLRNNTTHISSEINLVLFYIGVTNNLERRIREHKRKYTKGFSEKYNIDILIYYEIYNDSITAIEREKQLKNWNRKKKILLITKTNPKFEEIIFDHKVK